MTIISRLVLPLLFLVFLPLNIFAQEAKFPNVTGQVYFQGQYDRITSNRSKVHDHNAHIYIEPNLSLNLNQNWSIKTDWRLQQNDTLTTRDETYPERYRTFMSSRRGIRTNDIGLIVEELKLDFRNEDVIIFAGKFDPTFGTAYKKTKRLGIFTNQFAEDYNLREKIGAGLTGILESSKLTFNTFFNDTTDLSKSAIDNRGRATRSSSQAGETGTLSSYSFALDGTNFLGVENLFYNVGYRSLGVNSNMNAKRETGYTFTSEYLYEVGTATSITPFIELVKINDFNGEMDRDAYYTTAALVTKFSGWNLGVSYLDRYMRQKQRAERKINDHQFQVFGGYLFKNNLSIDVTRSAIREGSNKGGLFGVTVSYMQTF